MFCKMEAKTQRVRIKISIKLVTQFAIAQTTSSWRLSTFKTQLTLSPTAAQRIQHFCMLGQGIQAGQQQTRRKKLLKV